MARTLYCSFCGESNHKAGMMLEGNDRHIPGNVIRICRKCAEIAIQSINEYERQVNQGTTPYGELNEE